MANSTVQEQAERIGAILGTFEVEDQELTVYTAPPRDVASVNTPAFIIVTAPASYDKREIGAADLLIVTRNWRLLYFAKEWQEGVEGEAEEMARPIIDEFKEKFPGRPTLELADGQEGGTDAMTGIQDVYPISDTGVINLVFASRAFAGVEFQIAVVEYSHVNYAP